MSPARSIAIAIVLAFATAAHADDRSEAEHFFRAGEKAYKAQRFDAAAKSFEMAYQALPLPEIAFSTAQAYRRQYRIDNDASHVARAIELYRAYLAVVKTGGRVADAADALAEMQHELDTLIKSGVKVSKELAAEHTQLGVDVMLEPETAGAMREVDEVHAETTTPVVLTIDGTAIAPVTPMNVAPGPHEVHVEAEGYFPIDRRQEVAQGDYKIIDIKLVAKPAKVAIVTEDGARISIDGRPAGTAPIRALDVAAGKHLLAILRDGREPFSRELVVTRGAQLTVEQALVVTWKRHAVSRVVTAGCVTGGLFLLATALAIVEDTRASNLHDTFTAAGNQPPSARIDFNDDIAWRDRGEAGMWTFGGLTAVLGVTAALLYYTDKPSLSGTF